MIELKGVSRFFENTQALKDIDLQIGNGLTFLVGPSGAGKSTLASIIAGIDQDYTGTVRMDGCDVDKRSESETYHSLNTNIGFIWQNFHLISSRTAAENVELPLKIAGDVDNDAVKRALRAVGMEALASRRVHELSGGQRQRVAIARELVKNPTMIIADEPTSALDAENARNIVDTLRSIARNRSVVVITHDESLIEPDDGLIRLESGKITEKRDPKSKKSPAKRQGRRTFLGFSATDAIRLALDFIRHNLLRCGSVVACAIIAAIIAAPIVNGSIQKETGSALSDIYNSYGENALDVNIVRSFVGTSDTDDESSRPNVDVSQNIDGLLERYAKDSRVKSIYTSQSYDDIEVEIDGKIVNPTPSGDVPALNSLVAGEMPKLTGSEVVIPLSVAKGLNLDPEEAIGKSIIFRAKVTVWNGDEQTWKPVETEAVISGVADTTMKAVFEGKSYEFEIEDAFFFSPESTLNMRKQAGLSDKPNFTLRPSTPEAMIEIKNELSAEGIVPLGNFELVENTVNLQKDTQAQSQTASTAVIVAVATLCLAISIGASWARRREGAILRVCGCSRTDLASSVAAEGTIIAIASALFGAIASAILGEEIPIGAGIATAAACCAYLIQTATVALVNPFSILKRARR